MKRVFSNKLAIFLFMLPAALFFLVIIILPVILSSYYSLTDWNGVGEKIFIGFDNFKHLFVGNIDKFPQAVRNSFLFMVVSVFIQLPISLLFAFLLTKKIKGTGFFRSVYFIPVVISTIVIGQLWMKIYHPEYGILNTMLKSIGLDNLTHAWLGEMDTALIATFIPILWQYVGYHMLLMYAAMKSISPEIYEAAKVDGAGPIATALRITLPLIVPMLKVSVVFSITGSLKVFDLIFVLTDGGPAKASEVPSTLMKRTMFMSGQYGYGSAMAVFIIIECLVFTLIARYIFSRIERNIMEG